MNIPTKFVINLLPHSTRGNYGVGPKDEIWCNLGAKEVDGKLSFVWDDVGDLFAHEFSHPIVNPLVDKYAKLPKNYFKKIYPQMIEESYGESDLNIMDELIIRSIEYVFVKYYYKGTFKGKTPTTLANSMMADYKEIGFIYIDILTKLVEDYYLNRDKFSNFEAFMPTLIKEFKKGKAQMDKQLNETNSHGRRV